jgi:hypothetical protein
MIASFFIIANNEIMKVDVVICKEMSLFEIFSLLQMKVDVVICKEMSLFHFTFYLVGHSIIY